jgi:uncharacterized protein (TIGR00255 family)
VSLIRSMTGFGRAESTSETYVLTVEARSVNHRHLDVALRLPKSLASVEPEARKLITSRVERGRVDVQVQVAPAPGRADHQVVVDASLARQYVERARALGAEVGLDGDVDLAWVLERPGVFRVEDVEPPDPATLWPELATTLGRALEQLTAQRAAEGASLAGEMHALLLQLESEVARVAERAPVAAARREGRLRDRIRALVGDALDETRILTEAAAWAEKTDVAEELARLRSHVDQFRSILDKGGPLGRRLDFLIQELHREVNTIGSKADDLEVSHAVVAAKGVIEKMREQTQNLE